MQFLLYSLLGALGMMLDFTVFYIVIEFSFSYQVANLIGYTSGTLLSFGLQRRYTFRVKNKTIFRLILFFVIAGIGYIFSAVLLWFFVEYHNFNIKISKIFTLPMVAVLQYLLNRKITFGKNFF